MSYSNLEKDLIISTKNSYSFALHSRCPIFIVSTIISTIPMSKKFPKCLISVECICNMNNKYLRVFFSHIVFSILLSILKRRQPLFQLLVLNAVLLLLSFVMYFSQYYRCAHCIFIIRTKVDLKELDLQGWFSIDHISITMSTTTRISSIKALGQWDIIKVQQKMSKYNSIFEIKHLNTVDFYGINSRLKSNLCDTTPHHC